MFYTTSTAAISIFFFFVAVVLGLSFYLGRKAKSAAGYYAAHGQINWFVNGVAFAGDYLSAASFLGICGLIAFYGYDGFLYSIGYLAGWIVALFVIAEPIKRLGKFTFADALDSQFNSRAIKLTAALSTLLVSIFYLIPQMVGAGALITPLLGLPTIHLGSLAITPYAQGVIIVGIIVTTIVITAGMVSTTWVQFIKGSLLVFFCSIIVLMILNRGLKATPAEPEPAAGAALPTTGFMATSENALVNNSKAEKVELPAAWKTKPYVRYRFQDGSERTFRVVAPAAGTDAQPLLTEAQVVTTPASGPKLINGKPQSKENDLRPIGTISKLGGDAKETGPTSPTSFLAAINEATIVTWSKDTIVDSSGSNDVYYQKSHSGKEILTPGGYFTGLKSAKISDHFNFISLMLALFCGTASLPHILIRYYTVKDQASARKSTIVGIASIGFFYILTLYLGLGAMTSGTLDPTNNNMAAPLLAKSFSNTLFALISAIAFTTVLGTVSGLIMAGAGAVAHDLMSNFFGMKMADRQKVFYGKVTSAFLGAGAIVLGIIFQKFNVSFLVGWAFNIAASANLPSLVMLLFWRRTTSAGIASAISVGLFSSLGWILLSPDCYRDVYGWDPAASHIPFSQPALVTIPLGFITLVLVSLVTSQKRVAKVPGEAVQNSA